MGLTVGKSHGHKQSEMRRRKTDSGGNDDGMNAGFGAGSFSLKYL